MPPHRALDAVGIHLDTAVVEKAHQAVPVIEAVADHLGNCALVRDRDKPVLEPGLRLERGRFLWPSAADGAARSLWLSTRARRPSS
jgi:hypothetical protein